MKRFLLYAHGGSYNHGAEAIVSETIRIIRGKYKDAYIAVSTHFPEQDRVFGIDADRFFAPDPVAWESERKATTMTDKLALARAMYRKALTSITEDTVLLSVGGDNFCYGNWYRLQVFQEAAIRAGARSVLWGASIDRQHINPDMIEILRSYDVIIARESLTHEAVQEKCSNVECVCLPDPAFGLQPVKIQKYIIPSSYVCINISPLVLRRSEEREILLDSFVALIRRILEERRKTILLPHVVMRVDDDRAALRELMDCLPQQERKKTILIEDNLSAAEYKGIIAKSECAVCMRTHVSIAAYSSSVPVMVIGYSAKSQGIGTDMGMDRYVLSHERINSSEDVTELFWEMHENREHIRRSLDGRRKHIKEQLAKYADYI